MASIPGTHYQIREAFSCEEIDLLKANNCFAIMLENSKPILNGGIAMGN